MHVIYTNGCTDRTSRCCDDTPNLNQVPKLIQEDSEEVQGGWKTEQQLLLPPGWDE